MALMMGEKAVSFVVKRINTANIKCVAEVGGEAYIRAYKYEKGDKTRGEYITVNHLPFTHGQGSNIGTGIVNINVHVPQLKSGGVPTKRLQEVVSVVVDLFPQDLYGEGAYYGFYCDSRPTLDNDETYFVNLQIRVTYNNLQTE